jgi:light-regulated signal transduction histidine kinase (bacteriophytochrome)
MGSLIDAILGLAKLTRCPLHRVRVDLTTLATQVAEEVAANYPGHVVEFVVQPGLAVDADEDLLRVALGNLLDNAWKYTARVARARVEVHGTVEPGQAVFHVKDNGAGFDVTRAVNLFGAFQRYHTSVEFEGNGVGLATVQRIVHRHGGAIWAQSAVDQGATFSFTLGAAQDDPGSP